MREPFSWAKEPSGIGAPEKKWPGRHPQVGRSLNKPGRGVAERTWGRREDL